VPLSFSCRKFNWKMHKSLRREEGALSGLKWHTQSRGALWEWRREPGHCLLAPAANLRFPLSPAPASPPLLVTAHRRDQGVGLESIQVSCLDPKGIIKRRFNEIRKFSSRCLKASSNTRHFLSSRISWGLWPHRSPIAASCSVPLYMLVAAELPYGRTCCFLPTASSYLATRLGSFSRANLTSRPRAGCSTAPRELETLHALGGMAFPHFCQHNGG